MPRSQAAAGAVGQAARAPSQQGGVDLRWGRQLPQQQSAATPTDNAAASRAEQQQQLRELNADLSNRVPSSLEAVGNTIEWLQKGPLRSAPNSPFFAEALQRFMPAQSAAGASQQQQVGQQHPTTSSSRAPCPQPLQQQQPLQQVQQQQQEQQPLQQVQQQQPLQQQTAQQPQPGLLHGLGPVMEQVMRRISAVLQQSLAATKPADALMRFNSGMYEASVQLINSLLGDFESCLDAAGVSRELMQARLLFSNILHVVRAVFDKSIAPSLYLSPGMVAAAAQVQSVSEAERCKVYYIGGYVVSTLIVKHILHAKDRATPDKPYPGNVNWQFVHCLEVLKLAADNRGAVPANVAEYMTLVDRGGLTWVTPAFFDFMVEVEEQVRVHLNRLDMKDGMVLALKDALIGRVATSLVWRDRFASIVMEGLQSRSQGLHVDEEGDLAGAISLAYVSIVGLYVKVRRHLDRNKSEHRRQDSLRRQLKNAAVFKKQAMKFVISTASVQAFGGCQWDACRSSWVDLDPRQRCPGAHDSAPPQAPVWCLWLQAAQQYTEA